jgi:hypothetical protein
MSMDTSKLPKWARDYVAKLESDVEYWKDAATAGPENSDTFIRRGLENDTPLGEGVTIRFKLQGERNAIEARLEDGALVVRTSWHGIVVLPQASNSIRVTEARD